MAKNLVTVNQDLKIEFFRKLYDQENPEELLKYIIEKIPELSSSLKNKNSEEDIHISG